ncbi:hypothetical protein D623_10001532 [Myotis brandtii]|uniref:Uncharacterized protein n=1 Tax=Myotis brandtii TaxID=109478 RepID=S7MUY3_MYOBR|nr:hypothetical protein D623_10001532 [Myotis brandtii]
MEDPGSQVPTPPSLPACSWLQPVPPSPAATWRGPLNRAAFVSAPIKTPLVSSAKQRLLEPIGPVGSLWKMLLPPCPPRLLWLL